MILTYLITFHPLVVFCAELKGLSESATSVDVEQIEQKIYQLEKSLKSD